MSVYDEDLENILDDVLSKGDFFANNTQLQTVGKKAGLRPTLWSRGLIVFGVVNHLTTHNSQV